MEFFFKINKSPETYKLPSEAIQSPISVLNLTGDVKINHNGRAKRGRALEISLRNMRLKSK